MYTVTICRQPRCSCPDHAKGNVCKHILFVMLRAIRLPADDPLVWQRALLTAEVLPVPNCHPTPEKHNFYAPIGIGHRALSGENLMSGSSTGHARVAFNLNRTPAGIPSPLPASVGGLARQTRL